MKEVIMKFKLNGITIILSILLLASVIYNIKILSVLPRNIILLQESVPNEESAIGIAKVIFKVYTGVEFADDDFSCNEDKTEWQVRLKNKADFSSHLFGIDDSGVFINKYSGTIRFVSIDENDVELFLKLNK